MPSLANSRKSIGTTRIEFGSCIESFAAFEQADVSHYSEFLNIPKTSKSLESLNFDVRKSVAWKRSCETFLSENVPSSEFV